MSSDLKRKLTGKIGGYLSRDKVIELFTQGVLILAKRSDIPNRQKKEVLLDTVNELIDEQSLPEHSKDLLRDLVDTIGGSLIENLIVLGKDSISFIKKKCCF